MSFAQVSDAVLFALSVLSAAVAGVEISGFFPVHARPRALRRPGGSLLIAALGTGAVCLTAAALGLGLRSLPWPAVIIAGGLAALAAPVVFESTPRRFWDSRSGTAVTAMVNFGLLGVLLSLHR